MPCNTRFNRRRGGGVEMNFNDQQKQAIISKKPLVVISAGAGSGKTRVLTERFVYICEQKLFERLGKESSPVAATVDQIVAITFTEKAAREMKDRIRGRIENMRQTVSERYAESEYEVAQAFWTEQKEALDTALITTFHSFCHKLLHEYAYEADVSPNFIVLDDVQAKLIQIDIFEELFDSPDYHQKWQRLYNYYTKGQLQDAIKAVYSQMKEMMTGDLTIEQFFNSETVIQLQLDSIEESRKAEMVEFYKNARPYVSDLNEETKGVKQVIDHFAEVTDPSFEQPHTLFSDLVEAMPNRVNKKWLETDPALYEVYEYYFKPLKETMKKLTGPSAEELEEVKEIINLFSDMLSVFHEKYDQVKRERAAMDFSDLQQKAISLLEDEHVQQACRKKYRHMMVDEFQDTNQLQMSMLEFIQPQFRFVVGDGKQSIYRFRGADVSLMKQLVNLSQNDKNGDFVDMSTNYRTCDSIIQFVNHMFTEIMGQEPIGPSYKIHYSKIESHRKGEQEQKTRVELITIPDKQQDESEEEVEVICEYDVIVNRMIEIMNQRNNIVFDNNQWRTPKWSDFAILIQARTKLTKLERALKDKKIPYTVYGGIGFYEKQEVRDMLTLIKWINRPWEPLYIYALLRSPLFGLTVEQFLSIKASVGEDDLATYVYEGTYNNDHHLDDSIVKGLTKLKELYEQWVPYIPQVPMKEYLEQLFENAGLKTMLLLQRNNLQQIKNVEKLIDVMSQFHSASLDDLLKQVDQLAALSEKEGEAEVELAEGNMVHIMTVHASKGLEFPIVFLPDLAKAPRGDSGNFRFDKDVRLAVQYEKEKDGDPFKTDKKTSPSFERIKQIAKDQANEEAKRLFYVAVTRARDYLVLSTIDKPAKDSWYSMLQASIEQNLQLQQYIIDRSDVQEQEGWTGDEEKYVLPILNSQETKPLVFSVSEVMTFMKDPLDYYYKYVIKVEDSWMHQVGNVNDNDTQDVSATMLGTIVHRACELLDNGYATDEAIEEAIAIVEDDEHIEQYERSVLGLINKYKEIDQLNLGSTIANEWSFSVQVEDAFVIGEIDKIVEKNGDYHIIDLKTNKSSNYEILESYYAPQLYLYKMAFEEQYKKKVSQLSLFFMRGGVEGFRSVSIDPTFEAKIKIAIRQMVSLRKNNAPKDKYKNQ